MSRDEAIKMLDTLATAENLPEVLLENTIQAEPLLFKEAQIAYSKRRRTL